MKKIYNFFFIILNTSFAFYKPKSSDILVFDEKGLGTLVPILKKKEFNTLKVRGEELNLFILIKMFFSFQKINYINYLLNCVKLINPRFILHHSVNNKFFLLKKNFPNVTTIFIQSEFIYKKDITNFKSSGKCDYAFVWGKRDVKNFKNLSIKKTILIGSILNNFIKNKNKKKYKNSYLFISQFRENKSNYILANNGKYIPYNKFMQSDKFGFETFLNYCEERNKKLYVLFSSRNKFKIEKEKFFFSYKKSKNLFFLKSSKKHFGYKTTQFFDKIFFVNSTLGFECLARGRKCFFLNIRNKFLGSEYTNLPLPKNGPNWTDSFNKKVIFNKIDEFMKKENKQTVKIYNKYFPRIIYYDKNNNQLKKCLNIIFKKK